MARCRKFVAELVEAELRLGDRNSREDLWILEGPDA